MIDSKVSVPDNDALMKFTLENSSQILKFIQKLLQERATGEAVFQVADRSAKIYLSAGEVLWAFAPGAEESFQKILLQELNIPKERILSAIQDCRVSGKKHLDDILLAVNIESESSRAQISLRHSRAATRKILTFEGCVAEFFQKQEMKNVVGNRFKLDALLGEVAVVVPSEEPKVKPKTKKATSKSSGIKTKTSFLDIASLLEHLRQEIAGVLACIVIDGKSGLPIATVSDLDDLNSEGISALYRDLFRAAVEAGQVIAGTQNEEFPVQEIIIRTKPHDSSTTTVLQSLQSGKYFLYLLLTASADLGVTEKVVQAHTAALEKLLG